MSLQPTINTWNQYYQSLTESYLFPNEYVVRSFLGRYPNLDIDRNYSGKKICDIGCGDGRNMTALHKFGFELYGSEISDEICRITTDKLQLAGVVADIRSGTNKALPFADAMFDHILSWNACYYMDSADSSMAEHVAEFARVLKPGGLAVVSVPSPGCFSLQGAEDVGNNIIRIKTDSRWNLLNGMLYYRFDSFDHIESVFRSHFQDFHKCTIKDDCYGLSLEYFIFVCRRR